MSKALSQLIDRPDSRLCQTFQKSGKVKEAMVTCARDLSTANQTLKKQLTAHDALDGVREALLSCESVEATVRHCAEELERLSATVAEEISTRADLEEKLKITELLGDKHRFLAFHDALTGLANRALFTDRLEQALAQGQRHGRPFVVLFIDLDNFKQINDACGHNAGDKVLHLVGERLQACVRDEDTVSRAGGDEFLCLLMEVTQEAVVADIAQCMIDLVAKADDSTGVKATVKLSIGIAMCPGDGVSAEMLLKNADTAMYKAKADGSGYCFASSLGSAKIHAWEKPGKINSDERISAALRIRLP
ncbi:MAG: diguanylate cyclase domain-containing protein [Phycisphaerae bacterium]